MNMKYTTRCAVHSYNPISMPPLRLLSRRLPCPANNPISLPSRRHLTIPAKSRPFPSIPSCPPATCACAATPSMPAGFEIDHAKPLNGSMPAYDRQVLLCTGEPDWPSKIEDMDGGKNVAGGLKKLVGRGGEFFDPYHNIVPLAASFAPSTPSAEQPPTSTSAYILPNFTYVPDLPNDDASLRTLVTSHLLPSASANHAGASSALQSQPVNDVLVLICGHGGRDIRCGVLGSILEAEFTAQLSARGYEVVSRPPSAGQVPSHATARVGLISHIGGHKFAGNIIIYVPPGQLDKAGEKHALAGKGIWYGRVMPEHVEGIVMETIVAGRVIEDMFRGGVKSSDRGTEILRL